MPYLNPFSNYLGPLQSIWQISAERPSKSQTRPCARTRPLVAVATVISGPIQYSVFVTTISLPPLPTTGTISPWIFFLPLAFLHYPRL